MRRCAFTPCFVLFFFWFPPAGCQTALFEKTTTKRYKKRSTNPLWELCLPSWLNLFYKLLFVTFLSEFPCVGLYPGHIWAGVIKTAYRRNVFHQLFGIVAVNVDGQSTTRGRNLQFYLPK